MTPKIVALSDQMLVLAQNLLDQQRPGVPLDMEAPAVKQMKSLLEEMERDVAQYTKEQTALYQTQAEEIQKDAAEELRKLTEPPPPEEDPAILDVLGRVTFRFMDQHAPGREVMSPHVETLLKLAKE